MRSPISLCSRGARRGQPFGETPDLGCVHQGGTLLVQVPEVVRGEVRVLGSLAFLLEASVHPEGGPWVPARLLRLEGGSVLVPFGPARRYRLVWVEGAVSRAVKVPVDGEHPTGERLEEDPDAVLEVEAWLHLCSVGFLPLEVELYRRS